MDNLIYWLWLSLIPNISADKKHFMVNLFSSPEGVFRAGNNDLEQVFSAYYEVSSAVKLLEALKLRDLSLAKANMQKAARIGVRLISYEMEEYPKQLKEIKDPPLVLFCIGDVSLLKTRCLAIVGTRRASTYGRWAAGEIAKKTSSCGLTIVSGMAEGIDSFAHKGCLACGGKTIAVLGTGADVCFPNSNTALYEQIAKEGLIVSEYPLGSPGYPSNFPQRNRIISGLSRDCIVVEGAVKSGSLITAGLAAEQDRNVFAVPGNINQPGSAGTNLLISEGVPPITSMNSVLNLLNIDFKSAAERVSLSPEERRLYNFIIQDGSASREFILAKTDLDASRGSALLSALEIKGLIRQEGSRIYAVKQV